MFKFSAYPTASFWDKTKSMLFATASIPAPQEQGQKKPSDKEKGEQEQGQQIGPFVSASLARNLA